jgi:hypothetical protein
MLSCIVDAITWCQLPVLWSKVWTRVWRVTSRRLTNNNASLCSFLPIHLILSASCFQTSIHTPPGRRFQASNLSSLLLAQPSLDQLHLKDFGSIHCCCGDQDPPSSLSARLKQQGASPQALACSHQAIKQHYYTQRRWQISSSPAAPCPAFIGLHTKVCDCLAPPVPVHAGTSRDCLVALCENH